MGLMGGRVGDEEREFVFALGRAGGASVTTVSPGMVVVRAKWRSLERNAYVRLYLQLF